MQKINVAIIGTGFIGPAHIEALRRLGFVNVIALADADLEMAKTRARQLHVEKAYGSFQDLLKDDSIDAVHVCTPNYLHFPMVKEALLAGKHVVCEKPMATSIEEGKELVELAKDSKLVTAVNFNMRFYPLIQQAKAMIQSGELGRIMAINGSYQQDWLLYETDYNWRIDPKYSGPSRAIADIGSHWLDCIEFITGLRIQRVCADFHTFYPIRKKPQNSQKTYSGLEDMVTSYTDVQVATEDYAAVLLKFDNGAPGSMMVTQAAAGRKNRMSFEISGSEKSLAWNCENPNELWIGRRDSYNEILIKDPSLMDKSARQYAGYPGGHAEGYPDTTKQLFNNVYKHILERKLDSPPTFPTFRDGYRELVLCDSIITSAKLEKWFDVNESVNTEKV